jgi:acetylornithine deacetylase/succinyl-diaminopimelate desuccinylase-like protein
MSQVIENLQHLIAIPSVTGNEHNLQLHIQQELAGQGIEAFFQEGNLVVFMPGQDHTRAFIMNSHSDVVDPGDPDKWTHGPWSGEIEDGRMYGRGTSDMKAGLAASLELADRLRKRPSMPVDTWFTFVIQEETDGKGTRSFSDWFVKEGYAARYTEMVAIFTEPTHLDSLEYGHRGNYFLKASIDGQAGHASRPHELNPHAIMEMTHFMTDLEQEMAEWKKQFKGLLFSPPTITPTSLRADSTSPNRVSDHCEAIFDLRTIPQFHEAAFERVKEIAEKRGISLSLVCDPAPSGYTDPTASIIKAVQAVIPEVKLNVSQAAADLGFLTEIGVQGIIYGPGEITQAHQTNESVEVAQVERAPDLYEAIYDTWASQTDS